MSVEASEGGGVDVGVSENLSSKRCSVALDWRWKPESYPKPIREDHASSGGIFLTPEEAEGVIELLQRAVREAREANAKLPGAR